MTDDLVLRVREGLLRLYKGESLRAQGLTSRVSKLTKLPAADVHLAFGRLRKTREMLATDWHPDHEPIGQVKLAMENPESSSLIQWRTAMSHARVSEEDQLALLPIADAVQDMSLLDLQRLATRLLALREARFSHVGQSRYIVSARYLLSSSKLLDLLPMGALKAFGIDPTEFESAPGYVIVAGPAQPVCVVLVENPQAMELALTAPGVEDVAWVATFGYGLSGIGDENGNQLASFMEGGRKRLHALVRKGNPPCLTDLLSHKNLYFWGDLDQEGLWIFHRLQTVLPSLRLSALNTPLIRQLLRGDGHPYIRATGKSGQKSRSSTDFLVSRLLSLSLSRAIDQEAIDVTDISKYAKLPLEMTNF